mmetsp:Transcript_19108/g.42807  ORF Transcript_19108/g.42807 Transcript_19108/m.42807 type:complete len:520 (-) Transcript_19108:113-1672(-)
MSSMEVCPDAAPNRAAPSRKRSAGKVNEAALSTADTAADQPPLKRRRLSQASVLCMREMFRALIRDGEIGDQERIVLQNAAVLLSQVRGETWVHFPDTQGELMPLSGTKQQLRTVRSFLSDVAKELQAQEISMEAEQQDGHDLLRLPSVPWSDGITPNELIGCCGPVVDLQSTTRTAGILDKVTLALPAQYMIRSRVRELLNYYHLRNLEQAAPTTSAPSTSYFERAEACFMIGHVIRWVRTLVVRLVALVFCMVLRPLARAAGVIALYIRAASGKVSRAVETIAHLGVLAVSAALRMLLGSNRPVWSAIWFFAVAFMHERLRRLMEFVVLMARLRVMLCLARWSATLAIVFYPFIFVAEKFLRWREQSWLLGCACDSGSRPSILSWIPVHAAWALFWFFRLPRFLPLPHALLDLHEYILDCIEPVVISLLDLIFSIGIASGLANMVKLADQRAQPRLVVMSMNVGKLLREGPAQEEPAQTAPMSSIGIPQVSGVGGSRAPAPQDLPEWRADGAWNLFD